MKPFLPLLLLLVGFAASASATVTIQFAEPYAGGIPSNLSNAAGVATNGMRWGIVVDTTGNGFAGNGSNYDAYAAGVATSGFLGQGSALTDDYYIAGTLTVDGTFSGLKEGDFTTVPGSGSILDDLTNIELINGISAGDRFALVWFNTNTSAAGDRYGFFTDASFLIPSNGNTESFGSPFVGNDPNRAATNTFALAPEPSRMLLVGFGALGLMLRRRRSVA